MRTTPLLRHAILQILVSSMPFLQAESQEAVPQVLNVQREVRIAYDAARLSISNILDDASSSWAIIRVKPIDYSYYEYLNWTIEEDGTRGRIPQGKEGAQRHILGGSVEMLQSLHGEKQIVVRYTMVTPAPWGNPPPDPERDANYSPFYAKQSGIMLCRLNDHAEGTSRFRPAFLLSEEWVDSAGPALQFVLENSKLFAAESIDANVEKLTVQTLDENPFVALVALRTLSAADRITDIAAVHLLSNAKRDRQAAMACVLLRLGGEESRFTRATEIAKMIEDSQSISACLGLVVAALTTQQHPIESKHGLRVATLLNAAIRRRFDKAESFLPEERAYFQSINQRAK